MASSVPVAEAQRPQPTTLSFKSLPGHPEGILVDIYPPTNIDKEPIDGVLTVPAVVYFHGGGLTVGDRQSWFPSWLYKQTVANGFAFVSADYRLLPPGTAFEVSEDIQDVLRFLVSTEITLSGLSKLSNIRLRIDGDAIAVSGSSAGGLCTYFAAMHCVSPCPKAMISMYGMGANFLTSHYIQPKTKPFFRGRELLDPNDFLDYLHPTHQPDSASGQTSSSLTLPPISSSPLAYHPQTYRIPGYPANPRMFLARLYLQMGNYLDYYTGHWGLSDKLRPLLPSENSSGSIDANRAKQVIPASLHRLFPQFIDLKNERWPATFLIHGTVDSAVPVQESIGLAQRLKEAGVENVVLREVEGKEHSFDYEPGAEEEPELARLWDEVGVWMRDVLGSR